MKTTIIIAKVLMFFLLFSGVFIILSAVNQNKDYYENSLICIATITDIKTDLSSSEWVSYDHTYYGRYAVNDKTYTNVEIFETETDSKIPDYSIGQTVKIRVLKDNPAKLAEKGTVEYIGGIASLICAFLLGLLFYGDTIWKIVCKFKKRRNEAN